MDRRRFLVAAAASVAAAACGSAAATPSPSRPASGTLAVGGSRATIELAKGGSFSFTLRPDKAPQTVARFVQKARSGFYQGLTFHRVENWVVQGGDPTGTGSGGSQVPSEYNDLPFVAGAVGIARANNPAQMNDSQFFVVKIGDKIKSIRIE